MPIAVYPAQIGSPYTAALVPTTANTNRDGSTGSYSDMAAVDSSYGGLIERISIVQSGPISGAPSASNIIRLWRKSLGGTRTLLAEFLTTASPVTPTSAVTGVSVISGTTIDAPWKTVNLRMAKGEALAWSIAVYAGTQDQYTLTAEGGGFSAQ